MINIIPFILVLSCDQEDSVLPVAVDLPNPWPQDAVFENYVPNPDVLPSRSQQQQQAAATTTTIVTVPRTVVKWMD